MRKRLLTLPKHYFILPKAAQVYLSKPEQNKEPGEDTP